MMAAARNDEADERAEPQLGDRASRAQRQTHRPAMTYRITFEHGFLRAELAHRETVEEMHEFLRVLVRNSARCAVILLRVRASKPLFHVERDGMIGLLHQIARAPLHRIALLADTPDLHASHEYLELIAQQHGVRARSFRSESEALAWFSDRRLQAERRQSGERRRSTELRPATERRAASERRTRERRAHAR